MLLGHVFERFAARTPFAVMSRSLLERTLTPESLNTLFATARAAAKDAGRKTAERTDAIRLLAFAPSVQTAELFNALLDPAQPRPIQAAIIQAISAQDDPNAGSVLVRQWTRLGPSLRSDVLDAILLRSQRVTALLDAVEKKNISAGEIEPARRQALLKNTDDAIRIRAEKIFASQINPDRQRIIEHYTESVARLRGDSARGALIFQGTCFQCHGQAANGNRVGPDLSTLEDRSPPTLLVAILDPNREVKPIFVAYDVQTADGRDYLGVIAGETSNSVTVRRAGGIDETILRARIKSMRSTNLSLMPDGLEAGINEQQMADLLRYLQDFRGR